MRYRDDRPSRKGGDPLTPQQIAEVSSAVYGQVPALAKPTMSVVNWRPVAKGPSLKGFVTICTPSGMIVYGISIHEKADGSRFIGLPSKPSLDRDKRQRVDAAGKPIWDQIVTFTSPEAGQRFRDRVLAALDAHLGDAP